MGHSFIIAEAGVNHNGSIAIAKKLIDAAAVSGADAVKFQTFHAENIVTPTATKASYQCGTTDKKESQFAMLKQLELSLDAHKELIAHCKKKHILFLSTAFDAQSIDVLVTLGLTIFKIPSGEITNLPYLRKIGGLKKKIIMSTGMAYLKEVKKAFDVLVNAGTAKKNITLLHCTTEYPAPVEDVNLNAMDTLRNACSVAVGYSDHTRGIEIPIAAAALGATVIEKHFTLDRTMKGPDHKASLEPNELKQMVSAIRTIEKALGNGTKKPSPSELKNISIVRKSIVAACDIKKGERFTENNLTAKRPGTGISPMKWETVMGKTAKIFFEKDECITL